MLAFERWGGGCKAHWSRNLSEFWKFGVPSSNNQGAGEDWGGERYKLN